MNSKLLRNNKSYDSRVVVLIFFIMFTVYVTTAEGYLGSDPRHTFKVTTAIKNQENIPGFVFGETRSTGNQEYFPLCYNGMLCSRFPVANSVMFIPFVLVHDLLIPFADDFVWHNASTERTFTALFFGPLIMAFSVSIVFLILRELNFKLKTSIIISFLYGLASTAWPLSQTANNIVPETLFLLGGILFLIKFFNSNSNYKILLSGIFFTLALHTRMDALLIIGIVASYIIWKIFSKKVEIKKFVFFISPIIVGILLYGAINIIRFNSFIEFGYGDTGRADQFLYPLYLGIFGQLFSPGYGIIVYCPLVITALISYRDFFKKNKELTILFLIFFLSFLFFYASKAFFSGGTVTWGPRYLFPVTVFLILPLAASLEIRGDRIFKSFLIALSSIGFFINLLILPKNLVPVWDCGVGGYGCFKLQQGLPPSFVINNPIYSNLASSLKFQNDIPPDILLIHLFGEVSIIISVIFLIIFGSILIKVLKNVPEKDTKKI